MDYYSKEMRNIILVTGSRAEYGVMRWIIDEISRSSKLNLKLIVTGSHLSTSFGETYKEIIKDGYKISYKVDIELKADSKKAIAKSLSIAIQKFSNIFLKENADLLVILGDRYEILGVAIAAMMSSLPIAHIHGGEITKGAIDDAIRHSITKISHLHFVANKSYADRVLQMGENKKYVFNFGAPGLDNIKKLKLMSKSELQNFLGIKLRKINFIITYHPETIHASINTDLNELLAALENFKDVGIIFTMSNADEGGKVINQLLKNFTKKKSNMFLFSSLGQLAYLSCLNCFDVVIGNSSSGISEAPSFKIPTVNIGKRQTGRLKASSIIDVSPKKEKIINAINLSLSKRFQKNLSSVINPYGNGGASRKIVKKLESVNLDNILLKTFIDR